MSTELQTPPADALAELFADDDFCCRELCRIREQWGGPGVSWRVIDKTLGFMKIHCSSRMLGRVNATLSESLTRQMLIKSDAGRAAGLVYVQ